MKLSALLRLAWRESRGSRKRLLFFSLSISLGVAALVAVASFSENLRKAMDENSKALLGADLVVKSSQAFSSEAEALVASLPGEKSSELSFTTMAGFPGSGESRLVQLRGLQGAFPFYGDFVTEPPEAAKRFQDSGSVLIDRSLAIQFGLKVGSEIRLGNAVFPVLGVSERLAGDSPVWESIAPRIYIGLSEVSKTGLIQQGSRVQYRNFVRLPEEISAKALQTKNEAEFRRLNLNSETVQDRKRGVARVSDNIEQFLRLGSLFALLLGVLGVAGGTRMYLIEKIPTAAILRCLGFRSNAAGRVFFLQIFLAAGAASIFGAFLGSFLQYAFPAAFQSVLPLQFPLSVSWKSIFVGAAIGCLISLAMSLETLYRIRLISPLAVLRGESVNVLPKTPLRILFFVLLGLGGTVLAVVQASSWKMGLGFSAGSFAALLLFWLLSKLLIYLLRKSVSNRVPYVFRQGCLNLFRPNNQTTLVSLVIGVSVFLTLTMLSVRLFLLQQIQLSSGGSQPNMILFDIQLDQLDHLKQFLLREQAPVIDVSPVVTMRVDSVDGKSVKELLARGDNKIPDWTLRREYRSTYRGGLYRAETLIAGSMDDAVPAEGQDIPVSLENGIAEKLEVTIGSKIIFDVQGRRVSTVVGSIRDVDWNRVQPNFFVVFPPGVLEGAPQFLILTTRAASEEQTALLQRKLHESFPTVSIMDVSGILKVVDDILGKFSVVVKFITFAILCVSLIVTALTIRNTAALRAKESALLKVLGASKRQLLAISMTEYFLLGLLAASSGALLSALGSWLVATQVFHIEFFFLPKLLMISILLTLCVALLFASFGVRGIFRRGSLELLRAE